MVLSAQEVLNDLESSLLICQTQTGDCVAQQPERISFWRSLKPSKDLRAINKERRAAEDFLEQAPEELTENESEDVDSSSVVGALGGLVDELDPLLPIAVCLVLERPCWILSMKTSRPVQDS